MSRIGLTRAFAGLCLLLLTLMAPGLAEARWMRAQTAHFNVYGEGFETVLRDYANKLEVFDAVLRTRHGLKETGEAPVRLDVYLVRNFHGLERVWPGVSENVAGFYSASPKGIFAVAICDPETGLMPTDVLFHEYTHHFMLQNYAYPYASWLVEGYAEYYMTTKITDTAIEMGHANAMRGGVLMGSEWIPLEDLLTERSGEIKRGDPENYYPQSWLLTHYLLSDQARRAQLDDYMRRVGRGDNSVLAMSKATGMSMAELDAALHRYTGAPLVGVRITLSKPMKYQVTVTTLPASADGLLLERLQMRHVDGRDDDNDKPSERAKAQQYRTAALAYVRRTAGPLAGDRFADLTLAEAEVRLGDRAAGEAILNKYLAANADDAEALWLSGLSRLKAAESDKADRKALYAEAKPFLARGFKVDPDNYQLLYGYSETRTSEPGYPDENTLNALQLAHQLAPQVEEISISLAVALHIKGETDDAVRLLTLVANDPHGGSSAKQAQALIKQWADAGH